MDPGRIGTPFFIQLIRGGGAPPGPRHRREVCPYNSTLVGRGGPTNCLRRSATNTKIRISNGFLNYSQESTAFLQVFVLGANFLFYNLIYYFFSDFQLLFRYMYVNFISYIYSNDFMILCYSASFQLPIFYFAPFALRWARKSVTNSRVIRASSPVTNDALSVHLIPLISRKNYWFGQSWGETHVENYHFEYFNRVLQSGDWKLCFCFQRIQSLRFLQKTCDGVMALLGVFSIYLISQVTLSFMC